MRTPLYKVMDDAELVEAYWGLRTSMHNNGVMAAQVNPRGRAGRVLANQMDRLDRGFGIVTALLKRRGVDPTRAQRIHVAG